jgi:hypothetical protein
MILCSDLRELAYALKDLRVCRVPSWNTAREREKESAICGKPIKEKTYLRPPETLRKTAKLRNDGPQHLTTKRDFGSEASAKP